MAVALVATSCKKEIIPIEVTSIDVIPSTLSLVEGDSKKLDALVQPSNAEDKTIRWASSNPAVASVSNDGTVTAVSAGLSNITATSANGKVSGSCVVEVLAKAIAVAEVSLDETSISLVVGSTATIIATVSPENATNKAVDWTSSNPAVATVSQNGKITAVAPGSATIIVSTQDGGKLATCSVTVTASAVAVTGVSLSKSSISVQKGTSVTLVATVTPEDATNKKVSWTSSKPEVATVDAYGTVTAVSSGVTTIIVTTQDGGKVATCEVTVPSDTPDPGTVEVTAVHLSSEAMSLAKGKTGVLEVIISPSNASNKKVTWSSSNESVATVDQNGVITAINVGTTTITATTDDGHKTAVCTITVTDGSEVAVSEVSLDNNTYEIEAGESFQLTATIIPSNATNKNVSWSSSDESVATVSPDGEVTGVAAGEANITVTSVNGGKTDVCKVTVKGGAVVEVSEVSLDKTSYSLIEGTQFTLHATINPGNATNKTLSWRSSNTGVATVSQNGLVQGISEGTATITVETANGKTATCVVTVSKEEEEEEPGGNPGEGTDVEEGDLDSIDDWQNGGTNNF